MDDVIQNIMSNLERQYKTMKVLVVPMNTLRNEICNNNGNNNDNYIQCHEVICPVCQESCKSIFNNYRITLLGCKNGHKIENIKLSEYMNYHNIDLSKIICGKCKKRNRGEIPNHHFFKCCNCNMSLCPFCKSITIIIII